MSRAARSVRWFSVYLTVLGVTLMLAPNVLLATFGVAKTGEVWIRVLGVVVLDLAVYYWSAAASEAAPFFRATVAGRMFVLVAFAAFVVLGLAEPVLILFGGFDLAGGLWTAWALRADRRAPTAALAG